MRRTAAVAALATLGLAAQATALDAPPRQTYTDVFTTDEPGASAGRTYAIDYLQPDDPEGKPHAFSHLHLELAEGARFDTSALPYCEASDAQLMAEGPSACPEETKVGTDETVVDTGVPGPNRYFTADFVFFNDKDELILVATARDNGARVVIRGKVGERTLDIENPPLPGAPPDGAAAKSQRGQFGAATTLRDGRRLNYITTPPTCPPSGVWVNRITYTYRDGVVQTAESASPCKQSASAPPSARDARAPSIRARGVPRRCVARPFRVRVRIKDTSRLRSARVLLDNKPLARSRRKRFGVRVPARTLAAGRHTIAVRATDVVGNRAARRFRFRRCSRR